MTFERRTTAILFPDIGTFLLTKFNYLYRIVFQCDTNYFHRYLFQTLNFLKKFLYYARNVLNKAVWKITNQKFL